MFTCENESIFLFICESESMLFCLFVRMRVYFCENETCFCEMFFVYCCSYINTVRLIDIFTCCYTVVLH